MKSVPILALVLALPLAAGAQVIRCKDPATGKFLYTDQPCKGGELVVPQRSDEDLRRDAEAAERARAAQQVEAAQREQQSQQAAQAAQAAAANRPVAVPPSESADCRAARADADFRARSNTATEEQIRTARYNAALACGQQPPAEIVVTPPQPWGAVPPPHRRPPRPLPGDGTGWQPANPAPQPPREREYQIAPRAPSAQPSQRSVPSSSGVSRGSGMRRSDDEVPIAPSPSSR